MMSSIDHEDINHHKDINLIFKFYEICLQAHLLFPSNVLTDENHI